MSAPPRSRRPSRRLTAAGLLVACVVVGSGMIATDTLRAGWAFERFMAHVELFLNPPPDRPTVATLESTPRPRGLTAVAGSGAGPPQPNPSAAQGAAAASPLPSANPGTSLGQWAPGSSPILSGAASASGAPLASGLASPYSPARTSATTPPTAKPTPTPVPTKGPVKMTIVSNPNAVFAHQLTKEWCAVAGTQIALTVMGKGNASPAFQRELAGRIGEWESSQDSLDGGWGPGAIALALKAYGVPGYEVRAYNTMSDALLDGALAISQTHKPVLLMAWHGAHTWVMTGYQATADPNLYADASLTRIQILDPWYPWISTIWGASHSPGFYDSLQEMAQNYLPWHRPEGLYPTRDGKFIAVVPTS
jgi:hypothetical protein